MKLFSILLLLTLSYSSTVFAQYRYETIVKCHSKFEDDDTFTSEYELVIRNDTSNQTRQLVLTCLTSMGCVDNEPHVYLLTDSKLEHTSTLQFVGPGVRFSVVLKPTPGTSGLEGGAIINNFRNGRPSSFRCVDSFRNF